MNAMYIKDSSTSISIYGCLILAGFKRGLQKISDMKFQMFGLIVLND